MIVKMGSIVLITKSEFKPVHLVGKVFKNYTFVFNIYFKYTPSEDPMCDVTQGISSDINNKKNKEFGVRI